MKFYIAYAIFIVAFIFAVNQFLEKPLWPDNTPAKTKLINPKFEKSFPSLTQKDTNTAGYHYQLIVYHFNKPEHQATTTGNVFREDSGLKEYYSQLGESKDSLTASLGAFGLAMIQHYEDLKSHTVTLGLGIVGYDYQKDDRLANHTCYNLALGRIYRQRLYTKGAIASFEKEISLKGDTTGAYIELIKIWHQEKNFDALYALTQKPLFLPYFKQVNPDVLTDTYFIKGQVFSYARARFRINTNYIAVIASLFIAVTWFLYLIRLKVFSKPHFASLISCFVAGGLFAFLALPLYDFFDLVLNFQLRRYLINDFLYMILGIGLIEETVKLLPFLLISYLFKGAIQEPIDYLILASVSALGFAATENFIYLARDTHNIVQVRAFLPTIGHLFDSSIIAYGMIVAKYRKKRLVWLYTLVYLGLAALTHGFYDFWLYIRISLFSVAIIIVGMALWITFLNNALNISPGFDYQKVFSSVRLRRFLIVALTGVVLFDYGSTALLKGSAIANEELRLTLFFAGFFMVFLSTSLANFDLVKGYWHPLYKASFFKKINYNRFIGTWVNIQPHASNTLLDFAFPDKVNIETRYVFDDVTNYFACTLDQTIEIDGKPVKNLFFQLKYKNSFFSSQEKNYTTLFYTNIDDWCNPKEIVYRKEILQPWIRVSVQKVDV